MPWPSDQKQLTRERILQAAARLFSSRGFDNVSLGEVMREANLTHGAFYAHFRSKQELYAEAVTAAARHSMLSELTNGTFDEGVELHELLAIYLDIGHVHQKRNPCPLAFLATDVANREDDVRAAYTTVYKGLVAVIQKKLPVDTAARRDRALALSALMVGSVAVARALNDESTVHALLAAARSIATEIVRGEAD